jgi:hypothetical protein
MKTDIAQQLSSQLNNVMEKLDNTIRFVKENCTEEEFGAYREGLGRVMGALVIDVMMPLYRTNPEAQPENLKE